jgi:hypothetical protein
MEVIYTRDSLTVKWKAPTYLENYYLLSSICMIMVLYTETVSDKIKEILYLIYICMYVCLDYIGQRSPPSLIRPQ